MSASEVGGRVSRECESKQKHSLPRKYAVYWPPNKKANLHCIISFQFNELKFYYNINTLFSRGWHCHGKFCILINLR